MSTLTIVRELGRGVIANVMELWANSTECEADARDPGGVVRIVVVVPTS